MQNLVLSRLTSISCVFARRQLYFIYKFIIIHHRVVASPFRATWAHSVVLISISVALRQTLQLTLRECQTTDTGRCACLLPSCCWYVLRLPTYGWLG